MSVNYILTSNGRTYTVPFNLETLQGIYAAQLLAGIGAYEGMSESLLANIGNSPADNSYGFKLRRADMAENDDSPILAKSESRNRTGVIITKYVRPEDYSTAYYMFLSDPLVFNLIVVDLVRYGWDITKTPFHTIMNFSKPNSESLFTDMFDEFITDGGNTDTIFASTTDDDPSLYYIGATPDARETFMVKTGAVQNVEDFLRGFSIFFDWATSTGAIVDYRSNNNLPKPNLYLYTYSSPRALRNAKDRQTMESQLPDKIDQLTSNYGSQ